MASNSGDKGKGKATEKPLPSLPVETQIMVLSEYIAEHHRIIYYPNLQSFNDRVKWAVDDTAKAHHWNDDYEDIVERAIFSTSLIEIPFRTMVPPSGNLQSEGLIPQMPQGLKAVCGRVQNMRLSFNFDNPRKNELVDVSSLLAATNRMGGVARIMPQLKSFTVVLVVNTGLSTTVKDAKAGFWKDLSCVDGTLGDQPLNKPFKTVVDDLLGAVKASFPSTMKLAFKLIPRHNPMEYRVGADHAPCKSWQFNCKEVDLDWNAGHSPFTTAWYNGKEGPLTPVQD